MSSLPGLKPLREERALSQRDLAALSGVAQASISQIEQGERKARPSTIRKLAKALGVEPSALWVKPETDTSAAAIGMRGWREFYSWTARITAEAAKARQQEAAKESISPAHIMPAQEVVAQRDVHQAYKHAMEQVFEIPSEFWSAINEYEADIAVARSKIASGDPQDVLEVSQLARYKVGDISAGLGDLLGKRYEDIADEDLAAWHSVGGTSRQDFRVVIEELRIKGVEAALDWLDFWNLCLDWLDDEIKMRRGEVTSLEDYVRRLGERAPGQEMGTTWRLNRQR